MTGLTTTEAAEKFVHDGPHELRTSRPTQFLTEFSQQFFNPLAIILTVASVISIFVGSFVSAAIIFSMVVFGAIIGSLQNYRSKVAVERLQKQVAPRARVLRDNQVVEIPRREVVVGDCVELCAGDMIPADAKVVLSKDLYVLESALTGEAMPVEKSRNGAGTAATVFLGSSVVSGYGRAVVSAIGSSTQFGAIATRLAEAPPPTDFDRGVRNFGLFIMQTVFVLVVLVMLLNVLVHRDLINSLLFAVALAVGLTPEFLPMILSVTLAKGVVKMARSGVIVKHLSAMQSFGSIDILCSDKTGTLTTGVMEVECAVDVAGVASSEVLRLAVLNSAHQSGVANPLDQALMKTSAIGVDSKIKVDEIPFDFERRRLSVILKHASEIQMITKGAPESVLSICQASPEGEATLSQLQSKGFRVIAVATKRFSSEQTAFTQRHESEMSLVGFIAFVDPPLPNIQEVFRSFAADKVEIKILTGDNEVVASHVCQLAGLEVGNPVRGTDLDSLSDIELGAVAERHQLFARVSPAQKNRIVNALKKRGHVVGFMGDGINDAPSLHDADVGISFLEATDVARETADVILTKRDLRVLHQGILEGRSAFGNVMKYLLMGTSSNFGNMFSMAAASVALPFLPMLPAQILLNNFLYDLAQITIPADHVDASFTFKPRSWDISLVRKFMIMIGPISSVFDFLTFYVLLKVFGFNEAQFHTGWFVESLITQTLVIFIIRTAGNPLRSRPSVPLTFTVLGVVGLCVFLPFSPLARILEFTVLPPRFFIFLVPVTALYLLLVDMIKRRLMHRLMT